MIRILSLSLVCAFTGFFQSKPLTILFLGDSLTAGYGVTIEESFPSVAYKILMTKEKNIKLINAGISGETSAGGLSRMDWVLRQPIDILFLELGANDGLRGLPVAQTEKNLQAIIDKAKAKNKNLKVVLAGMKVPPNMGPEYSNAFDQVFTTLAKKNKCVLMPFLLDGVAGIEKLNQQDGIHPNTQGHQIIGNQVAKILLTQIP
jgi:acyl-CoA thioesterase-1